MQWYSTMRHIHCLWCIFNPFLDAWSKWEGFLIALTCILWVTLSHLPPRSTLILHENARFGVPSQCGYHKEVHSLLMKCFKTFLGCIGQLKGAWNNMQQPSKGRIMSFSTDVDPQYSHKSHILKVTSQCDKCNDIVQRDTSIAYDAFPILPWMHKADERGFW